MRLFTVILIVLLLGTPMLAADIHVAVSGNDANLGTAEKPVATIAAAQKLARSTAGHETVKIWLDEGVYYLPETIRFTAEDSNCIYAALEGKKVVLSGGSKLNLKWEPYRDGIMQAKTPEGLTFDELFVNGRSQRMARYPNYEDGVLPFGGFAEDALSHERIARWSNPAGGFIHSLHKGAWGGMHYRITGKDDKGGVTYEGGWQNNRPSPINLKKRFVENIFEELDAPGEWFLNSKTGMLFFYPPKDLDLSSATIEIVRLPRLLEFSGTKEKPVRNVTIKGVTFRHAARTFMETKEPLLRSDWTIYRGGAVLFNGAEDCRIADCEFDQVGGNAIFVSAYNRRLTVSGCDIHDTGASGVAFVGDPKSVRSPRFQYGESFKYTEVDKTPGPKTDDYPADCVVEDCLIRNIGTVEKQPAGVQISMSFGITVRHCSIYETARAGINISEGTFGGHVIEFCDVFDTVRETGDHGSFNSWGRDRYWHLGGLPAAELEAFSKLDMLKPNIIRNSRWRCDHGWDVDLDDGSSNFEIYNNVFLRGGLKLREGFNRKVYNNIAVNCTLHPHVWYANSGDEAVQNIWMGAYRPAIMSTAKWGKEVDRNLFTTSDGDRTKFADKGCDAHSLVGDPMFVDPAKGDYTVKEGSPALKLGFKNFPMDQFGVVSPRLRKIARTPAFPIIGLIERKNNALTRVEWRGATLRTLQDGEFSAVGVPADAVGVIVTQVTADSPASNDGMRSGDFIQQVNGAEIRDGKMFLEAMAKAGESKPVKLTVIRDQQSAEYSVNNK